MYLQEKSEEILYFNLLVTVLVYSATIPCFHMFATLQYHCKNVIIMIVEIIVSNQ